MLNLGYSWEADSSEGPPRGDDEAARWQCPPCLNCRLSCSLKRGLWTRPPGLSHSSNSYELFDRRPVTDLGALVSDFKLTMAVPSPHWTVGTQ